MTNLLILVGIFLFTGFQTFAKCELPSGDSPGGSPPNIKGTVNAVTNNGFELEILANTSKVYKVDLSKLPESEIFTQFGGSISPKEIEANDTIEIWTFGCKAPTTKKIKPGAVKVYK